MKVAVGPLAPHRATCQHPPRIVVPRSEVHSPKPQTDEIHSSWKLETEMEMPECPVCLQTYDEEDDIIPRVLSCGHSACESCVRRLPRSFENGAFPCPACTQLVRFPNPTQGPSSLPKNIDLLRFSSSPSSYPQNSTKKKIPKTPTFSPTRENDFLPRPWTPEFYSLWKPWILPSDSITTKNKKTITAEADISNAPLHFRANQCVSLLPIAFYSSSCEKDSCFSLSYAARVVEALYLMGEAERSELGFIARASLRQRRVCAVYGVWMDLENGVLFLVCERVGGDMWKRVSDGFKDGIFGKDEEEEKRNSGVKDGVCGFAVLGVELCEVVMGLHSEGIAVGCLAPSCIGFDDYGRLSVDLNDVLELGRRVRKMFADAAGSSGTSDSSVNSVGFADQLMKSQAFVSPEMFLLLSNINRGVTQQKCSEILGGYQSDVWSLACILVRLIIGEERFNEELLKDFYCHIMTKTRENHDESRQLYNVWVEKVISSMDTLLGVEFKILVHVLSQCLNYEPGSRPYVSDAWRCIRGLLMKPRFDLMGLDISVVVENGVHCLIIGDLSLPRKGDNETQLQNEDDLQKCDDILGNISGLGLNGSTGDVGSVSRGDVDRGILEGLHTGNFKSVTLQGHRDCITGLAVGGGFLFSSSFDKTVHVWSLQDFSHVQSLKGHEHRVMAILVVDAGNLLCVSGDSGGGIFVWSIGVSPGKEVLKKWNDHNDWRYSGVHSLAVSGTDYLYSGSGDKSIKAWSMQDYTLVCTMNGHKSVVSSLAVCNGILYSGSRDGTVRLWWLSDHSPLAVLGDESPGNIASVLSLSVDRHMLVASYENGYVKIWKNDVLVSSRQTFDGAIFALEKVGKWLFMGGWNKIIDIQEMSEDEFHVDMRPSATITCDSVITSLLHWQGKLFVGFSGRVIKVYHCRQ